MRAAQISGLVSARGERTLVLMGDLNVRMDEARELCETFDLRDMPYSGRSWAPMQNRFYPNLQNYRGPGHCFDRILCSGPARVEGHLVGACREFCEGKSFFLSDHFGLLGFFDFGMLGASLCFAALVLHGARRLMRRLLVQEFGLD